MHICADNRLYIKVQAQEHSRYFLVFVFFSIPTADRNQAQTNHPAKNSPQEKTLWPRLAVPRHETQHAHKSQQTHDQ